MLFLSNQYGENVLPTALVQGRIAAQYEHLLRAELNDDWKILVWDPSCAKLTNVFGLKDGAANSQAHL